MTIVIDIGNTRIKWGLARSGRLGATGSELHIESMDRALDALAAALPESVDDVLVSNVMGETVASRLADRLREGFRIKPRFVTTAAEGLGVRCGYTEPAQLGVDRWVAMIAARQLAAGPVCVIDAGTAVTFDAVDAGGRHVGGLILAGPRIIANALDRGTEGIGATAAADTRPQGLDLLGTATDAAVGRGAMLSLAAALDAAVAAVAAELGAAPMVLLTGGDAELVRAWLETKAESRPDLVLEGLAYMASQGA